MWWVAIITTIVCACIYGDTNLKKREKCAKIAKTNKEKKERKKQMQITHKSQISHYESYDDSFDATYTWYIT